MTDILITGATGFVGSHLVERLAARGDRARALVRESSDTSLLDRYGFEAVVGSLSDEASLRRAVAGADTVLHLAAATRALDADTFHTINAEGTEKLVAALEAEGGSGRLVYLSSLAAVGPARGGRPVRPTDEPRPLTAYGRSKLAGERIVQERWKNTAVIRAPAVYGPGDRDLLTFFQLARFGILPAAGPPDRRVQLVHAGDLAEGLLAAATADATGVYHVAEPRAYRWDEVLERVARAVDRTGVRIRVPASMVKGAAAVSEWIARRTRRPVIFDRDKARELLAEWVCDTAAARRELGFEAATPLAEGLQETVAWYRAYGWL